MERIEKIKIGAGIIGLIICIGLIVIISIDLRKNRPNVVSIQAAMKMVMEAGYVQGQADALNGTIRVRPINDSTYVWISSPWGTVKTMNDTINVNVLHK